MEKIQIVTKEAMETFINLYFRLFVIQFVLGSISIQLRQPLGFAILSLFVSKFKNRRPAG